MVAAVSLLYWRYGGGEKPEPVSESTQVSATSAPMEEKTLQVAGAERVQKSAVGILEKAEAPEPEARESAEVHLPEPSKVEQSASIEVPALLQPKAVVASQPIQTPSQPEPDREEEQGASVYADARMALERRAPPTIPELVAQARPFTPKRSAVPKREVPVSNPKPRAEPEATLFEQETGYALYSRQGTPGFDQFSASFLSARFGLFSGRHTTRVGLTMARLETGYVSSASSALYGSGSGSVLYESIASSSGLILGSAYRYDGEHVGVGVELGTTPYVHNGIAAAPVGALELAYREDTYRIYGRLVQHSVEDSMLSYVGNRDIYSGSVWGRVLKRGAEAGLVLEGTYETAWQVGYYPSIEGVRTAENDALSSVLSVSRALNMEGFERFRPGVAMAYEDYGFNSEHYTNGHGGYFSPQRYWQAEATLEAVARFGADILLQLRSAAGYTAYKRDSVAIFPLENTSTGRYAATSEGLLHLKSSVSAGWQLSENAVLLAGGGYRNDRGRDEAYARFVITFSDRSRRIGERDLACAGF